MEKILPGVHRLRLGQPEAFVPTAFRYKPPLPLGEDTPAPFGPEQVDSRLTPSGLTVTLPLSGQVFGLGLQLKSFNHTGGKKTLRCNADPSSSNGESHAPVPFFVTTAGYGVFIDTARYVSLYFGANSRRGSGRREGGEIQVEESALYAARAGQDASVLIEIPVAQGVDLYIFSGRDMMEVVQRYNMFSGGGVLPPEWGLGVWYRLYGRATDQDWLQMSRRFRRENMPVRVLGLEPGWQSGAYPCTFAWDPGRAGNHEAVTRELHEMGYALNAWEHCYTHPDSPLYDALLPLSGEWEVWGGLVPDFSLQEAREAFATYHRSLPFDGYKLDECDGSDHTGGWSFPNSARFPGGMDGEQMHSLLGILYQQTMLMARPETYGSVRASHALAAPYPFVLYSDLYSHQDFIRGVATAGFSGLLWSPEVRDATGIKDLIRRIQTVIFSPQALINAWFLKNPPWDQVDRELNRQDIPMEGREEVAGIIRRLFETREELIPYLVELFTAYRDTGRPPFYAVALDFPRDEETWQLDDEYMVGPRYLFAPLTAQSDTRSVYLPEGVWTLRGEPVQSGHHTFTCALEEYLLFERHDL